MAKSIAALHRHPESREDGHHRRRVRFGHRRALGAEDGRSRRATRRTSRCRPTASTCTCATPARPAASARSRWTRKTGALRLLNYKESKGRGPSYVSVDGTRQVRARRQLRRRLRRSVFAGEGWLARSADRVRAAHRARACIRSGRPSRTRTGSARTRLTSSAWSPISAWTRSSSTGSTPRPASSRRTIRRSPR